MMSSDSLLPNYVEYYCNIKAALNHTILSMILGNIFIPKLLRRWYFASGSSYRQQAGNNTIILLFPGANVTDVVVKTNHQSRNMAILPLLRIVKASKKWENLNTSILFEKVVCTCTYTWYMIKYFYFKCIFSWMFEIRNDSNHRYSYIFFAPNSNLFTLFSPMRQTRNCINITYFPPNLEKFLPKILPRASMYFLNTLLLFFNYTSHFFQSILTFELMI